MKVILILLILLNTNISFANDDYLVTKEGDTIYGKIEWKTHRTVVLINDAGKQKFKADKVIFFQRGAFRFVSMKIEFPEFLLEVINDDISYYVEAHLKPKYVVNYVRKVYLKYENILYKIVVGNNDKNLSASSKQNDNISMSSSSTSYSFDFREPFGQILGKESKLFEMMMNNNFNIDDIEYLVELSNIELDNNSKLDELLNLNLEKGFSNGYVVLSNGEVVKGSIKFKGGLLSKEELIFKNIQGAEHKYNPMELMSFGVNNHVYVIEEIKNKKTLLKENIIGKMSLYKEIKNRKSYIKKRDSDNWILLDKKNKFLNEFKDNDDVYSRIIKNNYQRFEIKSMVKLYNAI